MRKARATKPSTERPIPGRRTFVERGRTRESRIEITRLKGVYGQFGYRSATVADSEGRSGVQSSGDNHALYHREKLVTQSRDFERNNAIYGGMLERATAYIVGNGFSLQAKTKSASWNAKAERYWREFWRMPEIRGMDPGREVERLVCKDLLTAGDLGVIKTDQAKIQLVESEQIAGKDQKDDGIEKDDFRRPTGFWVSPWSESGALNRAKAVKVDPKDFIFIVRRGRPSSSRGVPPCQAVFSMLHRINDVCDSEAIAWQMLARLAFTINRTNASILAYDTSKDDESKDATGKEGDFATRIHELDQAIIVHAEPGEEVKGIERNIPGKDFSASLTMFMRLLGNPLGLPLEIILLDWTKSNYSQSRAVLLQAFTSFIGWQYLLESLFYRKVYQWVIESAMKSGTLGAREDALEHEWIKPTFPWIDQLKEAEGYAKKLDRGFCTQAQVLKSLNADREEVVAAREGEIKDAIERAKRVKQETGVDVPWQLFAGLDPAGAPPPAAKRAAAEGEAPEDDAGEEKPEEDEDE